VRTVIYGSRPDGHAKVVAEIAGQMADIELVGLIDDYPENAGRTLRGLTVLGSGDNLASLRAEQNIESVLLGFGESRGRAEIVRRALEAGYKLPALVHASAEICPSASIGAGAQVLAHAYVGPDAAVGRGSLVNTGAILEHDVSLADGVVVSPAATICGRVRICSEASVGAGATILPDVVVGEGAIVGAGALVREDVASRALVAGVPARELPR
jgi:UDP-perosamine 4-acetyltransferase